MSRAILAVAAAVVVMALSAPASAQPHDHLKCFKVKDPSSYVALVDLRPLADPPFEVNPNCRVKVRSREFCIPVEKTLGESDAPNLDLPGQELENGFLCYSVKCPAETLPSSLTVSDQFGTRALSGLRTSKVCAPAILGAPPATTTTTLPPGSTPRDCTDAVAPACDGTCGDQNFACVPDAGACICDGVDVFFPCGLIEGAPNCLGSCDGQYSCVDNAGACQCALVLE